VKNLFSVMVIMLAGMALRGQALEQHAFFSGREYSIDLKLPPENFSGKNASWTILSRGSRVGQGKLTADDQLMRFMMRELRPGMVISASMRIGGVRRSMIANLYFFSDKPFAEMRSLSNLNIVLWPKESDLGGTLDKFGLPHTKVTELKEFEGDVLLLGGADFNIEDGLSLQLLKLAREGKKIIITPPLVGKFKLPNDEFSKVSIIPRNGLKSMRREFDNLPLASSIDIDVNGKELLMKFVSGNNGIGGAVIDIGNGMIIFSGWSLTDINNPTAIYLLRQYLDPSFR